jgi:hypothetical protein
MREMMPLRDILKLIPILEDGLQYLLVEILRLGVAILIYAAYW